MSIIERLVEWLERQRSAVDLLLAAILIALIAAVVFGTPAHGQLLLPDGSVNAACGPTPREPPLAVPPATIPAQDHLPGYAVVRASSAVPAPIELPAQIGGAGTRAEIDVNAKGIAIGWWLAQVGSVRLYIYAVEWSHLTENPGLAARLLLLAALPSRDTAAIAAIGSAYAPKWNILDMCDVWNPIVARLNASKPAPLPAPAPSTWKATGGTIFKFSSGRITSITARSAAKGAACDGVTKATIGATVFQSLVGGPADEVTGCAK